MSAHGRGSTLSSRGRTASDRRRRQSGQVLVIVAAGMVVLILTVGLVLDGGATFGQRRTEQRAADLAALAGANDLLLNNDPSSAESVALQVAHDNGFDPAAGGVTAVASMYGQGHAGSVQVGVTASHQNSFSSLIGMNTWQVSVSATAVAGAVTGARGSGPFIFSVKDFQDNGLPLPGYTQSGCPAGGCAFGTANGDSPITYSGTGAQDLAWTNFGTGNVDTSQVANIISGRLVIENDTSPNEYIGQFNNGFHNALFQDVDQYLAGKDVLVPITTEQAPGITDGPGSCGGGAPAGGGCFQGWAIFHVTQAVGGSDKHIYGYFVSQKFAPGGTVEDCGSSCPRSFGDYTLYLSE